MTTSADSDATGYPLSGCPASKEGRGCSCLRGTTSRLLEFGFGSSASDPTTYRAVLCNADCDASEGPNCADSRQLGTDEPPLTLWKMGVDLSDKLKTYQGGSSSRNLAWYVRSSTIHRICTSGSGSTEYLVKLFRYT